MSQKPLIGYVDLRVFAHATEDQEKVLTALRNLMPTELAENAIFEKNGLTGHHGNPITLFTSKLVDKKLLPDLLHKIGQNINALDKQELSDEINLHLEKSNLYLKFDKQSAFLGNFKFARNDPIHIKIHFKDKTSSEVVEICQNSGLLP